MKELMRHTDAEKIRSQQTELKRGLSKLCVIDSSVEGHPEKKLQQTSKCRHVSANKRQIDYMALEMKSACKAKIEHIVTRAHGSEEVNRDENGVMSTCLHIHSEQLITLCISVVLVYQNSVITWEKKV